MPVECGTEGVSYYRHGRLVKRIVVAPEIGFDTRLADFWQRGLDNQLGYARSQGAATPGEVVAMKGPDAVRPRIIAAALSLLCAMLFAAVVVFWALGLGPSRPPGWGTAGIELIILLNPVAFSAVGAAIALRQPANAIGWVCFGIGLVLMLGFAADPYGSYGRIAGTAPLPGAEFFTWLMNWTWLPAVGTIGTFLLLLFPDGRLPSPRWRAVAWLSAAVIVLASLGEAFRPGALASAPSLQNPYGIGVAEHVPLRLPGGMNVLLALCFVAGAVSVVLRLRRARGRQRLQMTWFAFAAGLLAVLIGLAVAGGLVAGLLGSERPLALRLLEDAVSASAVGLPVAIAIAVLKHDLYEIDVLINRTLVYFTLTSTLALAYFGAIVGFQSILPVGDESPVIVASSTLAVVALFRPLRNRIQDFVDIRFYRRRYDAARTIETFVSRLRHETDLESLQTELLALVDQTMQPAHASLWLRDSVRSPR
jgi:hypothetical protein